MLDLNTSWLPVVFRYAITLARKLGIREVWIDSICILQDHAADLRGELDSMAQYYQYYQYALFTLAADLSQNQIMRRYPYQGHLIGLYDYHIEKPASREAALTFSNN